MSSITTTTTNGSSNNYYLAYGANLHPKLLKNELGGIKPLSSFAVQVPSTYLSFDHKNLAFLEPCKNSVIISGFNDKDWKLESSTNVNTGKDEESSTGIDSLAYAEWIWNRCCPGLIFTGQLPPILEGVAYEISSADWPSFSNHMKNQGYFIPVDCKKFEAGDHTKSTGNLKAFISIINSNRRSSGLQPTTRYLRLVLLGAFFSTHILSQPYIGHLVLLRPYEPKTMLKKLGSKLFTLSLLPSFFLHYLFSSNKTRFGLRIGNFMREIVWRGNNFAELIFRPILGSGFRND